MTHLKGFSWFMLRCPVSTSSVESQIRPYSFNASSVTILFFFFEKSNTYNNIKCSTSAINQDKIIENVHPTVVLHTKRFETYVVALKEKINPKHTLQSSLMMKNEKDIFWKRVKMPSCLSKMSKSYRRNSTALYRIYYFLI